MEQTGPVTLPHDIRIKSLLKRKRIWSIITPITD